MSKFILFSVSGEEYGVPIDKVVEIILPRKIISIPKVPPYISGVINLRDSILPLMDLRKRLGMAFTSPKEKILIIRMQRERIGLLVDDVKEIVDIEDEQITSPHMILKRLKPEYLLFIAKIADRVIVILNLDNLLTSEEITLLAESKEALLTEKSPDIDLKKKERKM